MHLSIPRYVSALLATAKLAFPASDESGRLHSSSLTSGAYSVAEQTHTLHVPARSPSAELQTFSMPPGYRAELVASEPSIQDPVAMDIDSKGRLWVIEMSGYMPDESRKHSREPACRVVVLEDTNNDGQMDRRTVFMNDLALPRSIKVLESGVLIVAPPNLLFVHDRNGDLKADDRTVVRNDFGEAEGGPEHNANGLMWGMDNIMHTSQHTYDLKFKAGSFSSIPVPNRGQWGVTMDDSGRLYRNWNDVPLSIDLVPSHYYLRNPSLTRTRGLYEPVLDPKDSAIWPSHPTKGVNRGYRTGYFREDSTISTFTSACSPVIFRGDRLPKEVQGDAFIAEPAGNLIQRVKLKSDDKGRVIGRNAYNERDFLTSTDERFRPVFLFSAPDGTLYVVDMYRGVIQDGSYQTDYLMEYVQQTKLSTPVNMGRIWRIVHESTIKDHKPELSSESAAQLVTYLGHPNGWWRDTAQRLLVEKGHKSVAGALGTLAINASDYRTRLHALWSLDGLDEIDPSVTEIALNDDSPFVRASALRLSERWIRSAGHPLTESVLKKFDDPDWMVRRQYAATVGELPVKIRVACLKRLIEHFGDDPELVDIVVSGLKGEELGVICALTKSRVEKIKIYDALSILSSTLGRRGESGEVQKLLDFSLDQTLPSWTRQVLLAGLEVGLLANSNQDGIPTPVGFRGATLNLKPAKLVHLGNDLNHPDSALAKRILKRLYWQGKESEYPLVPSLTPVEEVRLNNGKKLYQTTCGVCHQPDGQGSEKVAANLVGAKFVRAKDSEAAIRIVLSGKEGGTGLMPPFKETLTDEQIASILTFIRREWGDGASPVTPEFVKDTREMSNYRKSPWTDAEIIELIGPAATAR